MLEIISQVNSFFDFSKMGVIEFITVAANITL